MRMTCLLVLSLLYACGSSAASDGYGRAHEESDPAPFELRLIEASGEPLDVSTLRGAPVLLFLFATFDLGSQAAIEPLGEFAKRHSDLQVVGVALQPNPRDLLQIFPSTLKVDFPLTYDPDNHLLQGLTDLGRIEGVPFYALIDRQGFVERKAIGPLGVDALERWYRDD